MAGKHLVIPQLMFSPISRLFASAECCGLAGGGVAALHALTELPVAQKEGGRQREGQEQEGGAQLQVGVVAVGQRSSSPSGRISRCWPWHERQACRSI